VLLELLPRRVWPWLEQLVGAGTLVEPVPNAPYCRKYWEGEISHGRTSHFDAPHHISHGSSLMECITVMKGV
jgi:hypothetical protein